MQKSIIAKKDASSIPFPITLMAAIVTFLWFIYGIILQNNFMIVSDFFISGSSVWECFILGAKCDWLYFMYGTTCTNIPVSRTLHSAARSK